MLKLWICFALSLSVAIGHLPGSVYGQSPPSTVKNTSQVSSSLTVQVSNETIIGVLTPAVFNLIYSGASIFKTSDSDKLIMKTKIDNQINNATQNVEGTDAANAIIGIEIGRAVRSVISPTADKHQTGPITIDTSSICKLMAVKSITCDNSVKIK